MNFHDVLIVSDYDWTLTDARHKIPESNLQAIRYFTENGGAFTLGSGRGVTMLEDIISAIPVNVPCVLSNGAVLYDYSEKKLLSLKGFSDEDIQKIIRLTDIMGPDMCMMIESGIYDYYMPQEIAERFGIEKADEKEMDEESRWVLKEIVRPNTRFVPVRQIPKPWIKVALFGNDKDMEAVKDWCRKNGLSGHKSAKSLYELQPAGISKGTGARNLLNILGRKVLVCIGDEENDLNMLNEADYGFVPLSAKESMKNRGFYLCASNDEGAVSDVIRQLELFINNNNTKEEIMTTVKVDAEIGNIEKVTDLINLELEKLDCPLKTQMQIDVALDEVLSNIAYYAYGEEKGQMEVCLKKLPDGNGVILEFSDNGKAFNPLTTKEPDTTSGIKERPVGGLGIFLVRKTMDDVSYERKDGKNLLTVVKKW